MAVVGFVEVDLRENKAEIEVLLLRGGGAEDWSGLARPRVVDDG